jgi:nucleoside-diphosphate-sugar epimerase
MRFFYASSTGVYAQSHGEWVDEDSPTEPTGFSGLRVLEGERLALEGVPGAVVVRFGGIYGPGRTRLVDTVRRGATCVESPPLYTNRIHRDDCAGVLRHLLSLERAASAYVAVDHAPAPQCEVMDWLAARLGVPAPRRVRGQAPEAGPGGSKRCRNARLLASGYAFLYPTYREGYAALLG